jgi:hypothetical protein
MFGISMLPGVSGILSSIRSGGFINPVSMGTSFALSSLSIPDIDALNTMAIAQAALNNTVAPSFNQLQDALNVITNAGGKVQELLGHTDRISGVNLSGNGTLATIAKTVAAAKNINGESSCSTVLAAFGAIQNSAQMVTEVLAYVQITKSFLSNIIGVINDLPNVLGRVINNIGQQIVSDVAALATAQLTIIEHSIAQNLLSLFQDECTSQVLAAVMSNPLKKEVTSAVDKIKSRKLIQGIL